MKRLFALLALITMILAVGVLAECTDSDGGEDFATKGTTTYSKEGTVVAENVDFCKDDGTLLEYFCDSTGKTTSAYKICACADGACTDVEKPAEEVPAEVPEEEPAEALPEEVPEMTSEPEITPVKPKAYTWVALLAVLAIVVVAVVMFLKMKKKKGRVEVVQEGKNKK